MSCRRVARWALAALLALGRASLAGAAPPAVHVAPADDALLATMLLAAEGAARPVLLFDPRDREAVTNYAAARRAAVRCFRRPVTPDPVAALLEAAAGKPCTVVDDPLALARTLWPKARVAVAAPVNDHEWLLRAAAFAAVTGSALLPLDDREAPAADRLAGWELETLYLTPPTAAWKGAAGGAAANVVVVETADALTAELLAGLGTEPPRAVVVANPRDGVGPFSPSALSLLAPLVSAVHRAPLVLTSGAESNTVEREVLAFLDTHGLRPSHILLVGDELALRSHRVPDPVQAAGGPESRGGGTEVRVELFSEIQNERPQDFAVGRLVAEDAPQASAALARRLHGSRRRAPKPVVFLANADEIFALGETISRTTAADLRNVGVPVRGHYREEVTAAVIQKALNETDVLVWEGHPRDLTLEERGGIAAASAPQLVVLQGCYTLDRSDPFILMEKGAEAIVATSFAVYSAPGSAFARAFFDALIYDGADLGTAVRNARNYLLALAQLQRAREHADWRKTYRAALAFALWGDPTARAPLRAGRPTVSPARWALADGQLALTIPPGALAEVAVGRYRARPVPRAMLGGLLLRDQGEEQRRLKEMYFTVQPAPPGVTAACGARDGWDVVSLHAPRTGTLSVLVRPDWLRLDVPARQGTFAFPLSAAGAACPAPATPAAVPDTP